MNKEIKIAMADDHAMFRKSIAHILMAEYKNLRVVVEAADGKELLDMLYRQPESDFPDLCILDLDMPNMNGPEVLPHLLQHYPRMQILTLSVFDHEQNILHMIRNEARGFIHKGATIDKLYGAILTVAHGGYYHPEVSEQRLKRKASSNKENMVELSDNEITFLQYCMTEMTYKGIASAMALSNRTIDQYREKLFVKLGCQSRVGLVVFALKSGIYLHKNPL